MRNNCSDLKFDLFSSHIAPDTICCCRHRVENAEHYLVQCPLYIAARIALFHQLRRFHPLNENMLLFGSETPNFADYSFIFTSVQLYIKESDNVLLHSFIFLSICVAGVPGDHWIHSDTMSMSNLKIVFKIFHWTPFCKIYLMTETSMPSIPRNYICKCSTVKLYYLEGTRLCVGNY